MPGDFAGRVGNEVAPRQGAESLVDFRLAGAEFDQHRLRQLAPFVDALFDERDGFVLAFGLGLEDFCSALEELSQELSLPVGPSVDRGRANIREGAR